MSDKKFLSQQDILQADDLKTIEIEVPEWGGWLLLQEITAGDRDWLEASMLSDAQVEGSITLETEKGVQVGAELFRIRLVTLSIIDPKTRERLFSNKQVEQLAKKSNVALNRLGVEVLKLNGMAEEEVKQVGEDLERVADGDSNSDSLLSLDGPSEKSKEDSPQEN